MLGWLADLSPWWWIAFAILLAAAEMLTVTTVLMGAAGAALATGLALWALPGMGGAAQIALFAGLTIVLTFAGRALVGRYGQPGGGGSTLNRRADQVLGREAVVVLFTHREGQVTIDGVPWPARIDEGAASPEPGTLVRVVGIEGIVVRVRAM
jgi:membrane protein implicated in regulation of membrane protease activity